MATPGALGAVPAGDGRVTFRVWAPDAREVAVLVGGHSTRLEPEDAGFHSAGVVANSGDSYVFELDGNQLADPCSRWQPEGLRGPSRVLDTGAFAWSDEAWGGIELEQLVVYELHVGTFTREGTFDAVVPRLRELAGLGVTAIEVMPVATFPGAHGWGYDGVFTSAPHVAYGGPEGFARLVDAAHAAGLGVILDVVYNHIGPGSELIGAFGPYFTDRHETFWGAAIDYGQPGVREWAIQNAELWVGDYHVDGLRLDATHAVFDDSHPHVLAELATRVRKRHPGALVISEMEIGDRAPIDEWAHDAQWDDSLHHAVHVLLTGEREGYYEQYGRIADVARAFEDPQAPRLVVCAQNHDQVGNRALGDRLRGQKLRLAAFCSILSRGIPLLFMGEEYDESSPFQFFSDHDDPEIAKATTEGRRREFARFSAFSGDVPDPQSPATFLRSKLDPARGDEQHRDYYRRLLELRRGLPDGPVHARADEERRFLRVRRGDVELRMNFSDEEVDGVAPWSGEVSF